MNSSSENRSPAINEPWFWVVMSPLILVVLVCSVLIFFAVNGADDRVYDDYYKKGRLINKQFGAEKRAVELGIHGDIGYQLTEGKITLSFKSSLAEFPEWIEMNLSHPASAAMDFQIKLLPSDIPGNYSTLLNRSLAGRWYVVLSSGADQDKPWRIPIEIDFDSEHSLAYSAFGNQ